MGNCWTKIEEWLCPNPWSGLVIDKMDYRYTVRSVSIDEVYNSIKTPPATPALNAQAAAQQPQQPPPPPKTQPLPSPALTPLTPPLKNMEEFPSAAHEQKTPLLTATAQPKYNSVSSSPLILSGKTAVPAPPPLSLLSITMQKPLHIEY